MGDVRKQVTHSIGCLVLKVQNQKKIIQLMYNIMKLHLAIHWNQIIEYRFKCLKKGLNGIGISDLISSLKTPCKINVSYTHWIIISACWRT